MCYLCGADNFAQFASNASLLSTGVTSKHVLSSESGRKRSLLKRIINCNLRPHSNFCGQPQSAENLGHEENFSSAVEDLCPGGVGRSILDQLLFLEKAHRSSHNFAVCGASANLCSTINLGQHGRSSAFYDCCACNKTKCCLAVHFPYFKRFCLSIIG